MSNSIDSVLWAIAQEKARHDIAVTTSLITNGNGDVSYPACDKESLRFWLIAVDLFGQEWCFGENVRTMQGIADKCADAILADKLPTYNQMINLCALRDVARRSAAK